MVMYAGKPVETGPVDEIFFRSRMPYTLGLLGSLPRLDVDSSAPLRPIPGAPPSLIGLPPGCPFVPRCPVAIERCAEEEPARSRWRRSTAPPATGLASWPRAQPLFAPPEIPMSERIGGPAPATVAPAANGQPVISVTDLVKHYPITSGRAVRRRVGEAHAVCGVSLELRERETLGLVGESGCGKSTTARSILQLLPATAGSVRFEGQELTTLTRRQLRPLRQHMQVVFQDPLASLDPRMPVGEIVAEPLHVHGAGTTGPDRPGWPSCSGWSASIPSIATGIRTSSPAASGSGSASPGPSLWNRKSSCSTSQSPPSTSRSRPGW